MTDNLADWLLAQIAADEEVARAATQHPVPAGADAVYVRWSRYDTGWVPAASGEWTEGSALFARWDPARVLAECAAKRAVVEHFQHLLDPNEPDISPEYDDGYIDATQYVVKQLAQPYRDRDGYRTEWDVQ